MDLEDRDLAALEERLYSSIHHSYQDPQTIPDSPAAPPPALPTRVVSKTSVVNNASGTLPANMKRYWVDSAAVPNYGDRGPPYPRNKPQTGIAPKPPVSIESVPGKGSEGGASNVIPKMFITPYQSLLGNMGDISTESPASPRESANESTLPERVPVAQEIRQKESALQLKKKKQSKQPLLNIEKKLASLTNLINKERKENAIQTIEAKKTKAKKMRLRCKQQRIVAEITLDSSDEEQPQSAKPVKKQPSDLVALSEDEADEVIIIPTPPPPQICIDCSDEEEEQGVVVAPQKVQFALPKSQKKKKKKTAASPRCISPSNSSIMSDDFIVQHDRCRLNDSFTESIPNDDELECSTEGAPRPGPSGKAKKKSAPETRRERVPSISSEDTICTSSETTDQEKRPPEADKGSAPKGQPLSRSEANAVKGKKDTPTTKKTPSKGKAGKAVPASPSIEATQSPSVSKNKGGSVGTVSNDTSTAPLTPRGKPKAQCKSPLTLVLECARERFDAEGKQSAKKAKSKKDGPPAPTPLEASAATNTARTADADKHTEGSEPVPSKSSAGPKAKKKKNLPIPPVDDVVSSESDYDISLSTANKASTPRTAGKKSRKSAANFFEQMGDVSSESDYDESFLQTSKKDTEKQNQAKETKKRVGRKRKQYNSETYSDEDFACLLTDIVRAVSDTEEEEDEVDEDATSFLENENASTVTGKEGIDNSVTEQQTPSKALRNPKKKKKLSNVSVAAETGQVPRANSPNSLEEQPKVTLKKKKKAKESKTSSKKVKQGIWSTPDDFFSTHEPSSAVTTPVQQSKDRKSKETQPASNSKVDRPSTNVQIIADSEDDDDDDIRIVDNSYNGRTSAASGTSISYNAQSIGPDCAWNEEMKHFYNTSWADEDFNLRSVLKQMPRDGRQWPIVPKDRYPDPPKKELLCNICKERGHTKFKCRNKAKLPICFMCGELGHREPRCPKTLCLNCGAKTRHFVRGCKSCAKDADITCFSCGVRGHTQRSCPDLWRRYHSTIEDNVPLKEDFVKNSKTKWCCICCRPGHQAHNCNDARRIFAHPIPNISISSYMPAYRGEYNRGSKHQREEQQRRLAMDPTARYNLFSSDANECELNLPAVVQNENGFYYNFLRSTGLLERHERRVSQDEVEIVHQQERAKSGDEVVMMESASDEQEVSHMQRSEINAFSGGQRSNHATPEACSSQTANRKVALPIVEENSNYSFSEFHIEESDPNATREVSDVQTEPSENQSHPRSSNDKQMLSDFIPLSGDAGVPDFLTLPPLPPRPPRPQRPLLPLLEQQSSPQPQPSPSPKVATPTPPPPQTSQSPQKPLEPKNVSTTLIESLDTSKEAEEEQDDTVGKVLLSKDHAKLLLSERGSTFLNTAGKRHTVKLSITFESIGNVLVIAGRAEAQDRFHQELVRYLKDLEVDPRIANKHKYYVYSPRVPFKNALYIIEHLRLLEAGKESTRDVLAQLDKATNPAAQERYRKKLNILLFGVYGLRDGRRHLNLLRQHLCRCKNIADQGVLDERQRLMVNMALRYIFTGYDHKDYSSLVMECEELQKANKLKMITFNDLNVDKLFLKLSDAPVEENNVQNGTQKNKPATPVHAKNAKKGEKNIGKSKGAVKQNARYAKNGEHQQLNRSSQADEYFEGDTPCGNSSYDDFIMNTLSQHIDSNFLARLDNSTRYAATGPGWVNAQHSNAFSNCNQQEWGNFNTGANRDRYHWVNKGGQPNTNDQSDASSSNVARMFERENTLRDQELNQLQRLQNLLR